MKISKVVPIGYAIQSFSNAAYGFSTVLIASVFSYPHSSKFYNMLFAYASYAAGYFAMPIGACVFGFLGDKYGRKFILLISTLCGGIGVLLVGCIPSYNSIGVLAPYFLIMARLIEGICRTGEYSGVVIYTYETTYRLNKAGAANGAVLSHGIIGACFAAIIGSLIASEKTGAFQIAFGWRIPFILSGIAMIIIFFIRLKLEETLDYKISQKTNNYYEIPLKKLFKKYKIELFMSIGLSAFGPMSYCMGIIYSNTLLQECGLTLQQSLLICIPIMFYLSSTMFYSGKLSDTIGAKKQIIIGLVLSLILSPFLFLIAGRLSFWSSLIYMFFMVTISSLVTGSCNVLIASSFPVKYRFTGVSIADAFGTLIGRFSLFFSLCLEEIFHTKVASAIVVSFISFLGLIGCWIYMRKKKYQNNL